MRHIHLDMTVDLASEHEATRNTNAPPESPSVT